MDFDYFTGYYERVGNALKTIPYDRVLKAAEMLGRTRQLGQKVWIVGNGGSAATAMHFANDLHKMCGIGAIPLPAFVPTILAYGNDEGWENMFSHALEGQFSVGDFLIAISCSGSSVNVVNAAKLMRKLEGRLIALTGPENPKNALSKMNGIIISVEDPDIKVQEDVHLVICHSIAGAIIK